MGIKISIIGAGSSYTPELFEDLVNYRETIPVTEVCLVDKNPDRLSLIEKVAGQLVAKNKLDLKLTCTTDRQSAIAGSDFIILQIRAGGIAAQIRDEQLPMSIGLIGNETIGAGGFTSALRTLPAVLSIAGDIERLAPHAWLMVLCNPAGILTEALLNHTTVKTLGYCNITINTTYALSEMLAVRPDQVGIDSFGLNHLSWIRHVTLDGVDRLPELIARSPERETGLYQYGAVDGLIDPDWLKCMGMIPGWYNRYYYYPAETFKEDSAQSHTKGQEDTAAEEKIKLLLTSQGFNDTAKQILESKGGAQYYLPVLQVIRSMLQDRGDVIVADVMNNQVFKGLPADACIEIPVRMYRDRIEAMAVDPIPLSMRGLLQQVKAYEQLTISAALTGSRSTALAALTTNPLVGSVTKAREFFELMVNSEGESIPRFH
ncbi:MAG: hypothetical protein WBV22_07815 [Anaerolineaceae bacterium]